MKRNSEDARRILRSDQCALAANPDGSFSYYMPHLPKDASVPRHILLMTIIAAKIQDKSWADKIVGDFLGEMIAEADARKAKGKRRSVHRRVSPDRR